MGQILDHPSSKPIEGALVEFQGTAFRQVTDDEGRFAFRGVPEGVYVLGIYHLAYGVHSDSVPITAGKRVEVTVRIAMAAIEVPPLEVTVRASEGTPARGRLFDRDDLEGLERHMRYVGDMLEARIVPGVSVSQRTVSHPFVTGTCLLYVGGRRTYTYRPQGALDPRARQTQHVVGTGEEAALEASAIMGYENPCVEIFLNDVRAPDADFFLMDLPLSDVERIEFLRPMEARQYYGVHSRNGVLLIYTRPPSDRAKN